MTSMKIVSETEEQWSDCLEVMVNDQLENKDIIEKVIKLGVEITKEVVEIIIKTEVADLQKVIKESEEVIEDRIPILQKEINLKKKMQSLLLLAVATVFWRFLLFLLLKGYFYCF